jgi:hypothetical protein
MGNQDDAVYLEEYDPPATNPVFLRQVRGKSAYSFSRGVINIVGTLSSVGAITPILVALVANQPTAIPLMGVYAVLALVVIGLLWQCALVIFDIADTLLYDAARRNNT